MTKIIGILFAVFCMCNFGTVWAVQCPAGEYISYGSCAVCAVGQYRRETDPKFECLACKNIEGSQIAFPTTGDTSSAVYHDELTDCFAKVTFRGNGGKLVVNDTPQNVENLELAAYYNGGGNNPVDSCKLEIEGGNSISLCKSYKDGFKIDLDSTEWKWERDGFSFIGWYTDSSFMNPVLPDSPRLKGNVDLYAKWTKSCASDGHFVSVGDTCVCEAGYYLSEGVCNDCEVGYFCRQGQGKSQCDSNFSHSELRSKKKTECYAILTLDGNDGTVTDSGVATITLHVEHLGQNQESCIYPAGSGTRLCTVKSGQYSLNLEAASDLLNNGGPFVKDGLVFGGWYDNAAGTGSKVKEDTKFSGDKTLYAKWVCPQGKYMYDGSCKDCPNGSTTMGPGAVSDSECLHAFGYNDGVWTWPYSVAPGELKNIKNYP